MSQAAAVSPVTSFQTASRRVISVRWSSAVSRWRRGLVSSSFFLTACGEFRVAVGRPRRSRCGTQELIECSPGWDCWAPSGAVGAAVMGLVSIDPVPERVGEDPDAGGPP